MSTGGRTGTSLMSAFAARAKTTNCIVASGVIFDFTHAGHLTAIQTTPPYRRHAASPESVVGALIQNWMNK